jgi:hypothetical protein
LNFYTRDLVCDRQFAQYPARSDRGIPVQFIHTFQLHDFLDTLVSLFAAFVLGTLIGAERQYRQRSAGLRTNVLVCVGAAAFAISPIVLMVPRAPCA